MQEGVWGEVVEIYPVEEHQPTDKGVEREAQPPNKVGDEHNPLAWLGRGDVLSLLRSPVSDVGREVAGVLKLLDVIISDARGLPLAFRARSDHGWIEELARRGFLREDGSKR